MYKTYFAALEAAVVRSTLSCFGSRAVNVHGAVATGSAMGALAARLQYTMGDIVVFATSSGRMTHPEAIIRPTAEGFVVIHDEASLRPHRFA